MTSTTQTSEQGRKNPAGSHSAAGHHASPPKRPDEFRGTSFLKLTLIEIRKSVDTRSGRLLLIAIAALIVAILGVAVSVFAANSEPGTVAGYETFLNYPMIPIVILLPVIGVLAMTSEWSAKSALVTFTVTPDRARVFFAKLVAAVLISALATLFMMAAAAIAVLLAGSLTGDGSSFSNFGDATVTGALSILLNVLWGAAFGALFASSALSIVLWYVYQMVIGTAMGFATASGLQWAINLVTYLDASTGTSLIAAREFGTDLAPTLVSVGVFVLLPLAVGFVRWNKREVK